MIERAPAKSTAEPTRDELVRALRGVVDFARPFARDGRLHSGTVTRAAELLARCHETDDEEGTADAET